MSNVVDQSSATGRETSKKSILNFWVDLVTMVLFSALISTGILMKWILPPGTCDEDALKLWLGHARHWWGDIHFWVAMLMLALLFLHIYLHWSWVVKLWGRMLGSARSPLSWLAVILIFGLIAIPFIIPEEVVEIPESADHEESDSATTEEVAPCGITGLSCSDCPAADDRLFGGGCGDEKEETPDAEVASESDDSACADDPNACLQCPSAGDCSSAKTDSEEDENEEESGDAVSSE